MLRWPPREAVLEAVRTWAVTLATGDPTVHAVGVFGSLARGEGWGVGSDADLVILLRESAEPFGVRAVRFDTTGLPVPADLLVYSEAEWARLPAAEPFHRRLRREVLWLAGGPREE